MLIFHVRGAQSFNDRKTVFGQRNDSFNAAALALNIITSNDYLEQTIRELLVYQMISLIYIIVVVK